MISNKNTIIILEKLDKLDKSINNLIEYTDILEENIYILEKDLKRMTLRYEKCSEELRDARHNKKFRKVLKNIRRHGDD